MPVGKLVRRSESECRRKTENITDKVKSYNGAFGVEGREGTEEAGPLHFDACESARQAWQMGRRRARKKKQADRKCAQESDGQTSERAASERADRTGSHYLVRGCVCVCGWACPKY
jgi:hypothetical protein